MNNNITLKPLNILENLLYCLFPIKGIGWGSIREGTRPGLEAAAAALAFLVEGQVGQYLVGDEFLLFRPVDSQVEIFVPGTRVEIDLAG